jgi:hypothetical protein
MFQLFFISRPMHDGVAFGLSQERDGSGHLSEFNLRAAGGWHVAAER